MTNEIHRYICSDNIDKNYTESKFSESLFSSDCGYEEMRDLPLASYYDNLTGSPLLYIGNTWGGGYVSGNGSWENNFGLSNNP